MPEDPLIRERFGPYLIETRIAVGGTAHVYRVHHVDEPDRPLALKVLMEELLDDRTAADGFQREFDLMRRLDRPGIPRVGRFGEILGRPCFTMEYLVGPTIYEMVARKKPFNRIGALIAMVKLVTYCHNNRVIHNDVKPENFLVVRDQSRIYLMDFGNAVHASGKWTTLFRRRKEKGKVRGTPAYMAPELLKGKKPTFESDCYAIGATAHFLFTNRPPVSREEATDRIVKNREPEDVKLRLAELPRELTDVFERCLRTDPTGRPDHAQTVFQVIQRHFSNTNVKKPGELSKSLRAAQV